MIRLLLVDDHEIVRLGLRTLLDDEPDLQVVGEANTTVAAVEAVERLRPDLVLMDLRIPGGGIEATEQVTTRFPQTRVVVLTSFADDELIWRAIKAGALGYVLKQLGNHELLRAIRAVHRGEAVLDPVATRSVLERVRQAERRDGESAVSELSQREIAILLAVARGKRNREIGAQLGLSEKTVRNYTSKLLDKLDLSNRVELATYAVKHHLCERMDTEE